MGVANIVNLAMRGLQFLWVLLIMAIVGNMIAETEGGSNAVVNYSMFCAVIGMLALFYLIPATIKEGLAGHPIILTVTDAVLAVFYFTVAVAFSAEIGAHSCNNFSYTDSNSILRNTSPGNEHKRCREAQATTAFEWFGFAAFTISAVLDIIGGSSSSVRPGGIRTSKV